MVSDQKQTVRSTSRSKKAAPSYEIYAPRTESQRERLSRLSLLTSGPVTSTSTSVSSTAGETSPFLLASAMNPRYEEFLDKEKKENNGLFSSLNHDEIKTKNTFEEISCLVKDDFGLSSGVSEEPVEGENISNESVAKIEESLMFSQSAISHLLECIHTSNLVKTSLTECLSLSSQLSKRHAALLQKSTDLSNAAERLQHEELILSKHAETIGKPLFHYDNMDNIAIQVGVLFKAAVESSYDDGSSRRNKRKTQHVRGLAKVKVDSPQYLEILNQIDLALGFFQTQYHTLQTQQINNAPPPDYSDSRRDRRSASRNAAQQSSNRGMDSVLDYYHRAQVLQEAALFLIKEGVVDRINNTAQDIFSSLDLQNKPIPVDKLEASLIYTRFHGISSRSFSLVNILKERMNVESQPQQQQQKDPYSQLFETCESAYAQSREKLLKVSVKAHFDSLLAQNKNNPKEYPVAHMTRLASVFLIRFIHTETLLYLDFFVLDKHSVTKNSEEKDKNQDTSKKQQMKMQNQASIIASQSKIFQQMLHNLFCVFFHRTIRRALISVNDLDLLCQIVSVLREEWHSAAKNRNTLAASHAISTTIQDAQERLIFCAQNELTRNVYKFKPTHSDLDYPNKLLPNKAGEENASGATGNTSENASSVVEAQYNSMYDTWFPPLKAILKVLSKIFRVVDSQVFEDIAQQSVFSCTKSLKEAKSVIHRNQRSWVHSDLFLVKHLLILREQLSPFDIQLRSVEKQLDFSETNKAVTKFLISSRNIRQAKLFSLSNENALVQLLREGVSVQESSVDSKRDLEDSLRSACNDFIEHTAQELASDLFQFVEECKYVVSGVNGEGDLKTPENLDSFMHAISVKTVLTNTLEAMKNGDESKDIIDNMQLYLENKATQQILLKPVARKVIRALDDSKRYISEVCDNVSSKEESQKDGNEQGGWNTEIKSEIDHLMQEIEITIKSIALLKS